MNWLANVDPLFIHCPNGVATLMVLINLIVGCAALMGVVTLMICFECKTISDMQSRIGLQRWGTFGILQTLAKGIKLFFKEDLMPAEVDRFIFKLAPDLVLVPALITFSIAPVGGTITTAARQYSDDQLRGGVRRNDRDLCFRDEIILHPRYRHHPGARHPVLEPLSPGRRALRSLSHCDYRRTQSTPLDVVEAESELVVGFHTEYSALRFALFYLAEFMNTITMSAIGVTLFFGGPVGWVLPVAHLKWVFPIIRFALKTVVLFFCYIWFRAALPSFRYDQVMDPRWKKRIPLSLGWMLIVAGFLIARAWGLVLAVASLVLTPAFELGSNRETGADFILPTINQRPLPGQVFRSWSEPEEDL